MSRDIKSAYKAALIEEYESYRRAGRRTAADHVAGVLLAEHDYDVHDDGKNKEEPKAPTEPPAKENAAAEAPPEKAVEPAAAKKTTPPARKQAPGKPAGASKE